MAVAQWAISHAFDGPSRESSHLAFIDVLFRCGEGEKAVRAAKSALDSAQSDAERATYGGQLGRLLERLERTGEALDVLFADWDEGRRTPLHADRLSLILSRAGETERAVRVLSEALDGIVLDAPDRLRLEKRHSRLARRLESS